MGLLGDRKNVDSRYHRDRRASSKRKKTGVLSDESRALGRRKIYGVCVECERNAVSRRAYRIRDWKIFMVNAYS